MKKALVVVAVLALFIMAFLFFGEEVKNVLEGCPISGP